MNSRPLPVLVSQADSELPSGEAVFLQALFARLSATGEAWAVMRNHDGLPSSTRGSDLDLLISRTAHASAEPLPAELASSLGAVCLGSSRTLAFTKSFVLGRGNDGRWWGIRVDLNFGLFHKGAELLRRDFGTAVVVRRGVPVLDDGLAAVLGVLKEVLNNALVPERYLLGAREAAREDWRSKAELLAPMGPRALALFRELLLNADPGDCTVRALALRQELTRSALARQLVRYPLRRVRFEFSKLSRFLRPSGTMIAILGVDGVGKSTVINAILPPLEMATHGACRLRHLRPGLLPPLARLRGQQATQAGPVLDPHGSRPSGWLGSLLRIGWALADYVLGYWIRTRPFIAKQPGIVLFDRYAYDMGLDPRRFRIGLPPRVAGWFARLAPKPDLVICLYSDPSVILARKQELPAEEVARQVEGLRRFAEKTSEAVLVSTEGELSVVRDRVLGVILSFFKERQ